jgi:hypothetical protein
VEAVFSLERMTRRRNRGGALDRRLVRRAGPVALLRSQVLGTPIRDFARATLLGQALAVEHQLDPIECDILQCLEKPVAVSELVGIASPGSIEENAILVAIDSLQRRGLVSLMEIADRVVTGRG